jgi:hypothetical protein
MTPRERRGLIVLVLLFIVLGVTLATVVGRRNPGPASGTFENNPIVEQRLINLQKSR